MRKHACIIKSIVSSSLHPPSPPSSTDVHLRKKKKLLLGSLPPWKNSSVFEPERCGQPCTLVWAHSSSFFFFTPGSPNGRVATAGECKCHPVLPVNYTATKLIVCLVHSKKDAALAIDWPFVSRTDAALSFSHSLDLMVV